MLTAFTPAVRLQTLWVLFYIWPFGVGEGSRGKRGGDGRGWGGNQGWCKHSDSSSSSCVFQIIPSVSDTGFIFCPSFAPPPPCPGQTLYHWAIAPAWAGFFYLFTIQIVNELMQRRPCSKQNLTMLFLGSGTTRWWVLLFRSSEALAAKFTFELPNLNTD